MPIAGQLNESQVAQNEQIAQTLGNAGTRRITVAGTATQNQTLTASNTLADLDGLGTVGYQAGA